MFNMLLPVDKGLDTKDKGMNFESDSDSGIESPYLWNAIGSLLLFLFVFPFCSTGGIGTEMPLYHVMRGVGDWLIVTCALYKYDVMAHGVTARSPDYLIA